MVFIQSDINFVAVLVATVITFIIGFIWYSPGVFGNTWIKLNKIKKKKQKGMAGTMILALIAQFVLAYVIANIVSLTGAATLQDSLLVGFWTWLGFVGTMTLGSVLWEQKPVGLYFINNGHNLLIFLIISAIITLW